MKTNEDFFDSVSSFYDKMINFDSAIERRKEALSTFIDPEMNSAADLGSGTGLDSLALSLLGLDVTGFDISQNMIEQAQLNSSVYKTRIRFIQSSIDEITDEYKEQFDLAVSMGNTFANIPRSRIDTAASKIYKILKADGKAILQILNFGNTQLNVDRIVNITRKDQWIYVRFYDFLEGEINFNILKFNNEKLSERELVSTKLNMYMPDELKEILNNAGFKNIMMYDNLKKKSFDKEKSKDLIITAEK